MRRIFCIIFIFLFLSSPLAVFAQVESTPAPTATQVCVIPVYLFATQEGGALAITPVAENQYFYAYATSSEKVETGLINPTGTATAEDTSTELGNQPVVPMGLLLVAVGSDPDAVNSFLETGEGVGQRIFTGHEYDSDTSLIYMGARYYAGAVGRFLSEDPTFISAQFNLNDPQGLNSYSYVKNNPLKYTDPLGLREKTEHEATIGKYMDTLSSQATDAGDKNSSKLYSTVSGQYSSIIAGLPDNGDPKSFTIMNDAIFKWYDQQMGYGPDWSPESVIKSDYYSDFKSYKCSAFVGEVLYDSIRYANAMHGGWFSKNQPLATDWVENKVNGFTSVNNGNPGDIISFDQKSYSSDNDYNHVGINIGAGTYISVTELDSKNLIFGQPQAGIIIKQIPSQYPINYNRKN